MKLKTTKQNLMYWIIGSVLIITFIITCLFHRYATFETWLLFWGSLVWGLATLIAVVYSVQMNWEQQSAILKRNIKIQLFDKRYSVYNALAEAERFINRKDIILMVFSGIINPKELQKKLYEYNENVNEKASLSQTVFDETIYDKMRALSTYYRNIFISYIRLYSNSTNMMVTEYQQQEFYRLLKSNNLNISNYDAIIPGFDKIMNEWTVSVETFNQYFTECGIMTDFDKYLLIKDMDNFSEII